MKELIILRDSSCNINVPHQQSDANLTERKIIALQGKEKVGKTATLKKLIERLHAVATCIAQEQKWASRMKNANRDACAVFAYKGSYITITTRGDEEKFIIEDFDAMEVVAQEEGFEIDVYICAVHTKGKTIDYVETKAASIGAELHIYGKATYKCDNLSQIQLIKMQSQINELQAEWIFTNI